MSPFLTTELLNPNLTEADLVALAKQRFESWERQMESFKANIETCGERLTDELGFTEQDRMECKVRYLTIMLPILFT